VAHGRPPTPRKWCCWGGGCHELAIAGRFKHFCEEHARILAETFAAQPRPAVKPYRPHEPPPPTRRVRRQGEQCQVLGCDHMARRRRYPAGSISIQAC
jgi:hypothetical protein